MDFMLDRWDRKRIRDIPGIGMVFAERLEANLGGYCSVCMYMKFWDTFGDVFIKTLDNLVRRQVLRYAWNKTWIV